MFLSRNTKLIEKYSRSRLEKWDLFKIYFWQKKNNFVRNFAKLPAFFLKKLVNEQGTNVISEIARIARIVPIWVPFLVSKPEIEKNKQILVLVLKHEIVWEKFSFSSRIIDWKKEILALVRDLKWAPRHTLRHYQGKDVYEPGLRPPIW